MKKAILIQSFLLFLIGFSTNAQNQFSTNIFNQVVFYDGYGPTVTSPTPAGVVRLANDKYAIKLTNGQLDGLKENLLAQVKIDALCDNYDRIGGVFVSFVPSGENITSVNKQIIEIGRFITPFMNKNINPTQVPYEFNLNHLVGLFKSVDIRNLFDIWIELHLFGVPYTANTQVAGCAGRGDVFAGTLDFISNGNDYDGEEFFIRPMATNMAFNKYNATDISGTTTRIFSFLLENDLNDAAFHLITSNHGANANGEEYVRRQHHVYFNNVEVLSYKPGGLSCEPFRQYNTQPNGIYQSTPQSTAWWASWNNWCPGDKIPNRIIEIGTIPAGRHQFQIEVPAAVFYGNDGNFPLSVFLYSSNVEEGALSIKDITFVDYNVYPNPTSDQITINSSETVKEVVLYNLTGKKIKEVSNSNTINVSELSTGTYLAKIKFNNGVETSEKIIKK